MRVFTRQPKILFGAFAIIGILAAGLLSPTPANAETVTLKANDRIDLIGENAQGTDFCNVGAVGTDVHGNKVALTAGHCVIEGFKIAKVNAQGLLVPESAKTEIGEGSLRVITPGIVGQNNRFDYGFIKLNDNVELVSTGNTEIAAPVVGHIAVRKGNDLGISVTQSSVVITGYTPRDFVMTGAVAPGASGGPVTRNGTLIGVSSRTAFMYGLPFSYGQRADAAVADATARGGVGAGFQPY